MEHTNHHVFITGKAGTGKSTLLEYFRSVTNKKIVVLAPTGVAALNVRGETIHSFFRFKPDITVDKIERVSRKRRRIFTELDAIVIDEISMVRADLLDCVDHFLRLNARSSKLPFGGIQMIFIGDLYQLPPVVTSKEKKLFGGYYESEYFFDAKVMKDLPLEFVELEKIYRQKDQRFITLLNQIRNNTVTEESLKLLNSRVGKKFRRGSRSGYIVHLTTTNDMAQRINQENLNRLKEREYTFTAEVAGHFDRSSFPTDYQLTLRKGAQVMMLNNDSRRRWVNGTIGKVVDVRYSRKYKKYIIRVEFAGGRREDVLPFTWEIFHYKFNESTNAIETETVGSFTQFPMKLAWAVTIHKSQGKTFDRVIIDIGRGTFAHGQVYVALSRCTRLSGVILTRPIRKKNILMDWRIVKFLTQHQYRLSEQALPIERKIEMIGEAIRSNKEIGIIYLKPSDEKSRRVVRPFRIGEFSYRGKKFLGVHAFCKLRQEERIFRIDRILRIEW